MTIDVTLSLNDRPEEYKTGLFAHMERNIPFILYEDKEHYAMFYPAELLVECNYGAVISKERMKNVQAFQLRLAMAVVSYSFFESSRPVRLNQPPITVEVKIPKYLME